MTAVSGADREKAIEALQSDDAYVPWEGLLAVDAVRVLIEAGWRPPVYATLDPEPSRALGTGALNGTRGSADLSRLYPDLWAFDPRPEYVQDRAAYGSQGSAKPASDSEREALREQANKRWPITATREEDFTEFEIENARFRAAFMLGVDAVLAVLLSRETVAPTEEQIEKLIDEQLDMPFSSRLVLARAVRALLPGESREAVETKARAEQREVDARIAEQTNEYGLPSGDWVKGTRSAAAIREARS